MVFVKKFRRLFFFHFGTRIFLQATLASTLIASGGFLTASTTTRQAFQGITHIERTDWPHIPRAVKANILIIDLEDPDISFRVTEPTSTPDPTDPEQFMTQRERTLDYLNRVEAQVAINANFDHPGGGHIYSLAASEGTPYSKFEDAAPAINIDRQNNARVVTRGTNGATYETSPSVNIHNVVGGNERIVFQGRNTANPNDTTTRARTFAGLTRDNKTLVIVAVDEGQSGVSVGIRPKEAGDILIEYEVWDGIMLDGGGSTAMAMADPSPRLVNLPSASPPRQNVNNLAIFAAPVTPEGDDDAFSNVKVTPSPAEALFSWETEQAAGARVQCGTSSSNLNLQSLQVEDPRTSHTILLTGLTPATTYHYRLVAVVNGEEIRSTVKEFETLGEIIVDDADPEASFSGTWSTNSQGTGWGPTYRFANVTPLPTSTATYSPNLPWPGRYSVQTWYLASGNRATDTRFTIEHADGTDTIRISQQALGSLWRNLASHLRFEAGDHQAVRIFNDASGGSVVIADAVRWKMTQAFPLPHGDVPDWWMQHFFGTSSIDPEDDLNGNGFSLADEYFMGVTPTSGEPKFRFSMERRPDEALRFSVSPTYSDREYVLQYSDDLTQWNPAEDAVFTRDENTGDAEIALPAPAATKRFYRLQIQRQ